MRRPAFYLFTCIWFSIVLSATCGAAAAIPLSDATSECIECHAIIHPGIVEDWNRSRHAKTTTAQAMKAEELKRLVSSSDVPAQLAAVAVGCAECHSLRPSKHADTFDHNGHDIHTVVSPDDCATCHSVEVSQYSRNLMSHAHKNLAGNELYRQLKTSIIGRSKPHGNRILFESADPLTEADACFYCHGTKLKLNGSEIRDTELAGELEFPVIEGWPNQGVGRINLDGSMGSCSACHTRHTFSIEMARGPYTCKECHVGPDVPAFPVYAASKHGNIHATMNKDWNFKEVPWTVGKDFTAPTCGACHVSLLVDGEGMVIAERSHQMNNRLPWRIYGLIYAHPHSLSPDTTVIRNKSGLPLPTDLDGTFASKFLIGEDEMQKRAATMQNVCLSCHSTSWVTGHWKKFENTIEKTDLEIRSGTRIMQKIWSEGLAAGLAGGENPFDEAVEKRWHLSWLFYANSIRFTSAMAGGGDYGVFAGGRYQLSLALTELQEWHALRAKDKGKP